MRLDVDGAPHRNPDGETIECPHLHVYKEGYGDKWGYRLPSGKFGNLGDLYQTFEDFMVECNVIETPKMQLGLY